MRSPEDFVLYPSHLSAQERATMKAKELAGNVSGLIEVVTDEGHSLNFLGHKRNRTNNQEGPSVEKKPQRLEQGRHVFTTIDKIPVRQMVENSGNWKQPTKKGNKRGPGSYSNRQVPVGSRA